MVHSVGFYQQGQTMRNKGRENSRYIMQKSVLTLTGGKTWGGGGKKKGGEAERPVQKT